MKVEIAEEEAVENCEAETTKACMRNLMQAFDEYGAEAGIEPFSLLLKIKGIF
ncbi:hypothetical protein [Pseudomonas lini]